MEKLTQKDMARIANIYQNYAIMVEGMINIEKLIQDVRKTIAENDDVIENGE